jgi:methylmalonyl-CoA/ethylmalonyl-CoA epimerase
LGNNQFKPCSLLDHDGENLMPKIENIDHLGIVVKDIAKSLNFWQNILGINLDYQEEVPSMNLDLAFLSIGKTRIELLEPTSTQGNEYYDFLRSRGQGFHHICLEVDNIEEMLERLRANNIKLKDETAIELPGRKLAFLNPESCDGVVIEIYELT